MFFNVFSNIAYQYNGFNLILADVNSGTMVYISNRPGGDPVIQTVAPGLHVLSNGAIDSPWPKALCLGQSFKKYLETNDDSEASLKQMVEDLMMDSWIQSKLISLWYLILVLILNGSTS